MYNRCTAVALWEARQPIPSSGQLFTKLLAMSFRESSHVSGDTTRVPSAMFSGWGRDTTRDPSAMFSGWGMGLAASIASAPRENWDSQNWDLTQTVDSGNFWALFNKHCWVRIQVQVQVPGSRSQSMSGVLGLLRLDGGLRQKRPVA